MKKICVFCGNTPEKKNKEHVLPQWLLKKTGDPKRVVKFGYNHSTQKDIEFSWKSFTAPSCTKCNDKYASFEAEVKIIIDKLENKIELLGTEIIKLLDWLDKVRIGLWINYYYLEGNKSQIDPRLCIDNRLGKKDRFLQIHFLTSATKKTKGLNAFGVNTFVFQFNPSCFGLKINDLLIINGSNDFVISKNCGFPYPNIIESRDNGLLLLQDWKYDKITHTVIDNLNLHKGVLTIMQPIQTEIQFETNYYNDSYLTQNCIDIKKRVGKIFRIDNEELIPINDLSIPLEYESVKGKDIMILNKLVSKVYEGQNTFLTKVLIQSDIIDQAVKQNEEMIKYYENDN